MFSFFQLAIFHGKLPRRAGKFSQLFSSKIDNQPRPFILQPVLFPSRITPNRSRPMRWLSTWFFTRILRRNRNITYKLAPPTKRRDFRFRPQLMVMEDRNSPGSVLNGISSVMLDGSLSVPVAEMASVVGETALFSSPVAGAPAFTSDGPQLTSAESTSDNNIQTVVP